MEPARPDTTIPLVREELDIERRTVETGSVLVRKTVTERLEDLRLSATEDQLQVDRVAVDRMVDEPSGTRQEGDLTVIPVYEEVVTVQRRWRLKEELHVRKRRVEKPVAQQVALREENVVMERRPAKRNGRK